MLFALIFPDGVIFSELPESVDIVWVAYIPRNQKLHLDLEDIQDIRPLRYRPTVFYFAPD